MSMSQAVTAEVGLRRYWYRSRRGTVWHECNLAEGEGWTWCGLRSDWGAFEETAGRERPPQPRCSKCRRDREAFYDANGRRPRGIDVPGARAQLANLTQIEHIAVKRALCIVPVPSELLRPLRCTSEQIAAARQYEAELAEVIEETMKADLDDPYMMDPGDA
jgi:hypothetical protein